MFKTNFVSLTQLFYKTKQALKIKLKNLNIGCLFILHAGISCLFDGSLSDRYETISQCDFDLYFPDD